MKPKRLKEIDKDFFKKVMIKKENNTDKLLKAQLIGDVEYDIEYELETFKGGVLKSEISLDEFAKYCKKWASDNNIIINSYIKKENKHYYGYAKINKPFIKTIKTYSEAEAIVLVSIFLFKYI